MRLFACGLVAVLLSLAGCGGDDGPAPREDAGFDASFVPDGLPPGTCRADEECDDDVFCNGPERCAPADPAADAAGCLRGTPPDCDDGEVCTTDACSDELRACRHTPPDLDADGHGDARCENAGGAPLGDDCDDGDARAFPGNAEVCDSHDDDCNPDTFGFRDDDRDGAASSTCCNGPSCGGDCNDADGTIRPGVADGPVMACD